MGMEQRVVELAGSLEQGCRFGKEILCRARDFLSEHNLQNFSVI